MQLCMLRPRAYAEITTWKGEKWKIKERGERGETKKLQIFRLQTIGVGTITN